MLKLQPRKLVIVIQGACVSAFNRGAISLPFQQVGALALSCIESQGNVAENQTGKW